MSSPIYQTLKEDPSHPCVHLLHRFASDIWNQAPAMDSYHGVGQAVSRELGFNEEISPEMKGEELAKHLEDSHQQMEQIHWAGHGVGVVGYAMTHPLQILGGLASEGGIAREIPAMVGLDVYDSHGTLSNNPSLQGVTTIEWEQMDGAQMECQVNNCYGGSPTIGDYKIAPEFEAVIQAAENNQLGPKQFVDPKTPHVVVYNNLQNLDKTHGEGPRCRTIMLLNKKYPLAFRGTTFAKDSALYLMGKPDDVVWKTPDQFGALLLNQFKRSFDPTETGHGFYFHGTYQQWEPVFNAAIHHANDHFNAQIGRGVNFSPADFQGAYQEYVYSLLNAYNEMEAIKILVDKGLENPKVMAISACKENIDRGGMENTKYMYTRLSSHHENRFSLLLGVMHSRALSARDRVILHSRMPQILNFMKITEPEDFRQNMHAFFNDLKYPVIAAEYHPA